MKLSYAGRGLLALLALVAGCRTAERVELDESSFAVVHLTFET
jgi:hypothetical protein